MAELAFRAFLAFHVVAGLTCVVTGNLAFTSKKQPWRHSWSGTIYYWSFAVVFVSATALALLRWSTDAYLFVLGVVAFGFATLGFVARTVCWTGWLPAPIVGMGVSYIVLLMAFYVDNGPHLPLWQLLPPIAFWLLPSLIGLPLLFRALVSLQGKRAAKELGLH
jgi:hypothetical protein